MFRDRGRPARSGSPPSGAVFLDWFPSAAARTLGLVHVRDVEVGQTYDVTIPEELPRSRYPSGRSGFGLWDRLRFLCGERFAMTVTALDPDTEPPLVDGLRVMTFGCVDVELVDEQVAELGLPPGRYRMAGTVRAESGRVVEVPHTVEMTVPARWLQRPARPAAAVAVDLDDPHGG